MLQIIFWGASLVVASAAAAQTLPALPWTFIPSRVANMLAGAAVTTLIHVALSQRQDWSTASRLGFTLSPCSLGRCVCWSALYLAKALRFKPGNFTLSNCVLQFDVGTGRAQAAHRPRTGRRQRRLRAKQSGRSSAGGPRSRQRTAGGDQLSIVRQAILQPGWGGDLTIAALFPVRTRRSHALDCRRQFQIVEVERLHEFSGREFSNRYCFR